MLTELPGEPLRITIPSLSEAKQGADPATNRMLHSLFSRLLERSQEREILAQPLPFLSITSPNTSLIYSVASRFIAVTNDTSHVPPAWERVLSSAQENKLPFFSLLPPMKPGLAPSPTALADASATVSPPHQVAEATPRPVGAHPLPQKEKSAPKTGKKEAKKNERKLAKNESKTKGGKRLANPQDRKRGEKQIAGRTRTVPLLPVDANDLPAESLTAATTAPAAPAAPSRPLAPDLMGQLAPAAGSPFMDSDEDVALPEVQEQAKSKETPRDDFSVVKLFDQLFTEDKNELHQEKSTTHAQTSPVSALSPVEPQQETRVTPPSSTAENSGVAVATNTSGKKLYEELESFDAPATLVASTDSIQPPKQEPRVEVAPSAQASPESLPWAKAPVRRPALEVQLSEAESDTTAPAAKNKAKNTKGSKNKKNKNARQSSKVVTRTKPLKEELAANADISAAATSATSAKLPWNDPTYQPSTTTQANAAAPEQTSHPLAVIASLFGTEGETQAVAQNITTAAATQPPQTHAQTGNARPAPSAPVTSVNATSLANLAPAAGTEPPASSQNLDDMVLVPSTPDTPAAGASQPSMPPKEALTPAPSTTLPAPEAVPAPAPAASPETPAPPAPAIATPASATQEPAAVTTAPAAPPSTEEEKKALMQSAPPPPEVSAVPTAPPEQAPAVPSAAQITVPASEGAGTTPTPAPVAAPPEPPKTATAAPVETVESKPVEQKAKPNARALLLDAERQVKNKRGTSSKELLRKMPQKLGDQQPQLPDELLEPFIVDRSKQGREIYDPTDDAQVQNARSQSLGVKIEVKSPRIDTNHELEKAYNALMSGQTTAAQEMYRNVLDNDPSNVLALFGMATSYHRSGQFEKARTLYAKILSIDPNNRDALNNFLALVSSDAPEASLAQLEKLESGNPEFSPIPAQMAVIYQRLGNHEKAMQKMLRAVSLEPENLTYRYNLAVLMDRQGRREEAASLYRQLISAYQSGAIIPGNVQKIQERLTFLSSTQR